MNWALEYSKDSDKFLNKQPHLKENLIEELKKFILKLEGETINIDVKKLSGNWEGYYRIRKGDLRILIQIDVTERKIYIAKIDFRGSVY